MSNVFEFRDRETLEQDINDACDLLDVPMDTFCEIIVEYGHDYCMEKIGLIQRKLSRGDQMDKSYRMNYFIAALVEDWKPTPERKPYEDLQAKLRGK